MFVDDSIDGTDAVVAAVVALVSLGAITAAGALHRSGRLDRRLTMIILVAVSIAGIAATIAAATIKFANCDCR